MACPQLRLGDLRPAREVLTAGVGLWVKAACAGGLHLPVALSYGGSGAGQVNGSLRLTSHLAAARFSSRPAASLPAMSACSVTHWRAMVNGHAQVHQRVHRRSDALREAQMLSVRAALQAGGQRGSQST